MKTCQNCIVPDNYPQASFKDGICAFCRAENLRAGLGENVLGSEALLRLLTSVRNEGYDCLVPISGGKDSSYALFHIAKVLKLRPLAVMFDSGFMSKIARENVVNLCRHLSVELVTLTASPFYRNFIREVLSVAKFTGRFNMVCLGCEKNLRTFMLNEARKRKIPFIIWGSSDLEDSAKTRLKGDSFREEYGKLKGMLKLYAVLILSLLDLSLKDMFKASIHLLRASYFSVRDSLAIEAPSPWKKFLPFAQVMFKSKNTKVVYFFDYLKYEPFKYIDTLVREAGYRVYSGREVRMDCRLHSFVNWQQLKSTGLTADGFSFSVLVRHKLLSREEAARREEVVKNNLSNECYDLCRELGITL